jgi:hypothetical protein
MGKFSSMTEAELLCEIWDAREDVKYATSRVERTADNAASFVKYMRYSQYLKYSKYLSHLECEYQRRNEEAY